MEVVMEDAVLNRLEGYLINANQFMWGLGQGGKHKTYEWLRQSGVKIIDECADIPIPKKPSDKYAYQRMLKDLLNKDQNMGIEWVITKLIVPRVHELFPPDKLWYLDYCWSTGLKPSEDNIRSDFKINSKLSCLYQECYPFIEIKIYHQRFYFSRWGEFAGIWFEEIEPWLVNRVGRNEE